MQRQEALQVLGLKRNFTPSELKRRYRELMRRYHSDAGGSDFLAKQINVARDALAGSSNRPDVPKDDSGISSDDTGTFTTAEIVDYFIDEFKRMENIDLRENSIAPQRLKVAADEARQTLSFANGLYCKLPHMWNEKHLGVMVSRSTLLSRRK